MTVLFRILKMRHRMMQSRRIRWAWLVASTEEKENTFRNLAGKPEGKEPLVNLGLGGR
jgi:hypothetical protein